MYLLNILITIAFSFVNIFGSIITGKVPKGSIWQLMYGSQEVIDKAYWHDEDIVYQWRSDNDVLKALHCRMLDERIDNLCKTEKCKALSINDNLNLAAEIKHMVQDYNRLVL